MIFEKRQALRVQLVVNGIYKIFNLAVPVCMDLKEVEHEILTNWHHLLDIKGTSLSNPDFKNMIKVIRIVRTTPILSLITD